MFENKNTSAHTSPRLDLAPADYLLFLCMNDLSGLHVNCQVSTWPVRSPRYCTCQFSNWPIRSPLYGTCQVSTLLYLSGLQLTYQVSNLLYLSVLHVTVPVRSLIDLSGLHFTVPVRPPRYCTCQVSTLCTVPVRSPIDLSGLQFTVPVRSPRYCTCQVSNWPIRSPLYCTCQVSALRDLSDFHVVKTVTTIYSLKMSYKQIVYGHAHWREYRMGYLCTYCILYCQAWYRRLTADFHQFKFVTVICRCL